MCPSRVSQLSLRMARRTLIKLDGANGNGGNERDGWNNKGERFFCRRQGALHISFSVIASDLNKEPMHRGYCEHQAPWCQNVTGDAHGMKMKQNYS